MKNYKDNLGIGIANAVWVSVIGAIIILRENTSIWLLIIPILFQWDFIEN